MSTYSLWLRAHPQAIVADGNSETTITAEVQDASGRTVPDGTRVDFTTSLGTIDRTAITSAGVARVRLRGTTTVGTAMVSAVVTAGNAIARLQVDMLTPGTEMFDESFILVDSKKHLGYDSDTQKVEGAGGVQIRSRGLTINVEECQIDVRRNILRAKAKLGGDNITILRGDKEIQASALYYNFNSMNGVLFTPAEDGAKRLRFRGRDMFTEPDQDPQKEVTFDYKPISGNTMFIRARSLIIRPGDEVKIKRANFYLDGQKVLSMPLYVVPLNGQGAGLNRMLTYGTNGLSLDMPFYYSLTPNGTGSLRLKHSAPSGWGSYSGSQSWQLDLDQEYTYGSSTEGKFSVDKITSKEWGLGWTNRQQFNNDSQIYSYFDFPSHRNLYGSVDYTKSFNDYSLSLNFRGNKLSGKDGRYSSYAYLQSRAKPLIKNAIDFSYSTKLSYDSGLGSASGNQIGTGIDLQFYGEPIHLGSTTSINSSLTLGQDFGGSYPGSNANANVGMYKVLGDMGQLSLNYNYSWSKSSYSYSSQRLSGDLYLAPSKKIITHLNMTYGLSDKSTSMFSDIGYQFIPTWNIYLMGTYQRFGGYGYGDIEVALAKMLGRQEARVIWSQSQKRFRFEFSAMRF